MTNIVRGKKQSVLRERLYVYAPFIDDDSPETKQQRFEFAS